MTSKNNIFDQKLRNSSSSTNDKIKEVPGLGFVLSLQAEREIRELVTTKSITLEEAKNIVLNKDYVLGNTE